MWTVAFDPKSCHLRIAVNEQNDKLSMSKRPVDGVHRWGLR